MISPKKGSLPQNIFTKPTKEKIIPKIKLTNFETKHLFNSNGVGWIVEVDLFLNVIVFLIFLVFGKELLFHIKTIQLLHPTIIQRTNHSSLFRSIPTIQKQFLP